MQTKLLRYSMEMYVFLGCLCQSLPEGIKIKYGLFY